MAIDTERLLTEALRKHGIRLDPDDPAVVLVTLNRLVLEDVARSIATDIGNATREFEAAAGRLQGRVRTVSAGSAGIESMGVPCHSCGLRRRLFLAGMAVR